MSNERLKAQRAAQAALAQAESELERAAKQSRIGKAGKRGPIKGDPKTTPRGHTAADAEQVGRAVANHLGQGFHGMVRHHL